MPHKIVQGKQQNWQDIRAKTDQPIITIITSTFNAVDDLPWTIDSIKRQTYPFLQWIVVDGGSKDGTVELLKNNNDVIDIWFSEKDTGIYDAWNKALAYVAGDWVLFIGAGDEIYQSDTLNKVSDTLSKAYPEFNFVYGKVEYISEKSRKELCVEGEPWENYLNKFSTYQPRLPPHPGIFHHKNLFKNNLFHTRFKIISDAYFLMQNLDKSFLFIPIIIDKMPRGGISSTPAGSLIAYKELKIAIKELGVKLPLKTKIKSAFVKAFTKYTLIIFNEKYYGQAIDLYKILRRKPRVFTVK